MAYKLRYLPLARQDLDKAVFYLVNELGAFQAADDLIAAVDTMAISLKEMPYRFAVYPVLFALKNEVRCVPVGNYNLFYQVDEKAQTVLILRVLHQRQDIKSKLL